MRTYLRELRKQAGMNQTEVANKLGMTQTNYSAIESGKTKSIDFEKLADFGRIFGTTENVLFIKEMQYIEERKHGADKC